MELRKTIINGRDNTRKEEYVFYELQVLTWQTFKLNK